MTKKPKPTIDAKEINRLYEEKWRKFLKRVAKQAIKKEPPTAQSEDKDEA